jgi:tetratricopeptide (TPR) repeat protein
MKKSKVLFLLILMASVLWGSMENISAAESFLAKGISEYKSENYEEALELFIKAREQEPGSSAAAYYLGLTFMRMRNHKKAVVQFKDAVKLTPPSLEAYPELIEAHYYLNEIKEAKERIAEAMKQKIKPGRIEFLNGLILLREGNDRNAISAFKKAKGIDPSLSKECDLQIARAYANQRRFAEAKESLKAVVSADPPSELAAFAKGYENALNRSIEKYKAWRISVGSFFQYDDNVVLKPSTAIPGVVISGEKDSSVVTTLRASYTPLLREPWFFQAQYDSYTNTYFDNHKVNLIDQTVSLTPGYSFSRGMLTLPASYSHIWLREKEYMSVLSTRPTMHLTLSPNHIGQLSIGYARREMLRSPPNHNRDEERDGNLFSLSPGYVHLFSRGRGLFHIRYELYSDETEGRNWENLGNHLHSSLRIPLIKRVSLMLAGDVFLQDFQHTHTFFGMKRSDRTLYGTGQVKWEAIRNLNLSFQYAHTHANSNIHAYDYKRNVYTAGIEYTF